MRHMKKQDFSTKGNTVIDLREEYHQLLLRGVAEAKHIWVEFVSTECFVRKQNFTNSRAPNRRLADVAVHEDACVRAVVNNYP